MIAVAAAGCACSSISSVMAAHAAVTARPISARRAGEPPPGEREHEGHREQRAAEGRERQRDRRRVGEREQDDERADRRAADDAGELGAGERVADRGLQHRPRRRQARAAEQRHAQPRRARVERDLAERRAGAEDRARRPRAARSRSRPGTGCRRSRPAAARRATSVARGRQRAALAAWSTAGPTSPCSRRATTIRTGAPISAQTTPAGVSVSRPVIARPATSAASRIAAPHGIAIASVPGVAARPCDPREPAGQHADERDRPAQPDGDRGQDRRQRHAGDLRQPGAQAEPARGAPPPARRRRARG